MATTPANTGSPILAIENLWVSYHTEKGRLDPVRDVSLKIRQGESYGLVGESGSGKTTLARAAVRYLPRNGQVRGGRIFLGDMDLLKLSQEDMQHIWGARIGMVHQSPSTSVNPSIVIGEQIAEVARQHLNMSRPQAWAKALDMLAQVGMPDPASVARRYAHQLSGGMLQRVLIASALTSSPQLLIMDEPTTALDVTTQAVILDLLEELMQKYRSAVLYITHNLGVVARVCDRVGVMYAGELMEEGPIRQVFKRPVHPYTLGLLGCVPRIDASKHDIQLNTIPGYIPRLDELHPGCIFAERCSLVEDRCREKRPPTREVAPDHLAACWRWQEVEQSGCLPPPAAPTATLPGAMRSNGALLEANGMVKHFVSHGLSLPFSGKPGHGVVKAVDGISVEVRDGQTLGIVGESGCGKTTLVRCIVGLEAATEGRIELEGKPLPKTIAQRGRTALRKMQMVFQNPDASLNPQRTVGEALERPLSRLQGLRGDEVRRQAVMLLESVHLPESYLERRPHELSGGEKQRVAVARAIAANPVVMICDEPISSLDVSVQASLMNLLADLQRTKGVAYLFVSHDLAAVRHVSDWIAVVYLGRLWEVGRAQDVFAPPFHPYTEALLSAIPVPDPDVIQDRIRLTGSVPSAINIPSGCRFHTRCPRKLGDICETQEPPWQDAGPDHRICCHISPADLASLQAGLHSRDD